MIFKLDVPENSSSCCHEAKEVGESLYVSGCFSGAHSCTDF